MGLPLYAVFTLTPWRLLALTSAGLAALGWAGAVYALCRKRQVRFWDLARLIPQFMIIPWMRLYWVLRGEWKYRTIKPNRP